MILLPFPLFFKIARQRQILCVFFCQIWITPVRKVVAAMCKNIFCGHRSTVKVLWVFIPPLASNKAETNISIPYRVNFKPLIYRQNHIIALLNFLGFRMAFQGLQRFLRCRFIAFNPNPISTAFGTFVVQPIIHFWIAHFPDFLCELKIKEIFGLISLLYPTCLRRCCAENEEQANYGQ